MLPLIRCAQSIVDERGKSSDEGRCAAQWLSSLDEESLLQMAMMADCSDEALMLVRFFDTDDLGNAVVTSELMTFLSRVTWLCEERGLMDTGYTQHMLEVLSTRRTVYLNGCPRFVGGPGSPSEQTVNRCFERMCNWLQLCRHTIRAEVPGFEILQAFSAFDLKPRHVTPCMHGSLDTLARVLQIPTAPLRAQFDDFRPRARCHADNGLDNHAAWGKALEDARQYHRSREAHPSDKLVAALARYIAWNPSTSGVERGFGKAYSTTSMSRGSVSEARTDDEAQLFFSDSLEADAALCRAARTAWANNFGAPRQSPLVRLDTGKRKAEDPFSEATFLKRRRESVESGAASNPAAGSSPAAPKDRVVGIGDWQDSHDKEHIPREEAPPSVSGGD